MFFWCHQCKATLHNCQLTVMHFIKLQKQNTKLFLFSAGYVIYSLKLHTEENSRPATGDHVKQMPYECAKKVLSWSSALQTWADGLGESDRLEGSPVVGVAPLSP